MSTRKTKPLGAQPSGKSTVRRTVDLSLATHRDFEQWRHDTAKSLGLTRVTGQEVLAALVDALLVDQRLSRQITKTIAASKDSSA